MSKTRKDWNFVKGQIDYLELGNGWILFRFSNLHDISLVWNGRPWHVSGLNLVLRRWEPLFDPFSATIQRIDQWIKITRLPLELWEEDTLKQLLQHVGQFIRVDDIILNRSKGKYARVCLNIDITKPLKGSLFIPLPNNPKPLEVPISYEGLHEVCALCGSNAHALESCPETPKGPLKVIVEKFRATKLLNECDQGHVSNPSSSTSSEKWVTVAPKKRGRSLPSGKRRTVAPTTAVPAPPSVKVVSHFAPDPVNAITLPPVSMGQGPHISTHIGATVIQSDTNTQARPPVDIHGADRTTTSLVGNPGFPCRSPALEPASSEASSHIPSGSRVNASTPTSPLEGSDVEEDEVTMFLNLEAEEDLQLSTESSKKRRLEEGDASSPSHSLN